MGNIRDASQLLWPAVAGTLASLDTKPEDAAAAKLAQQYARTIDSQGGHCRGCTDTQCQRAQTSAWAMRWLGPLLLQALESLGATPAARAQLTRGKPETPAKPSGLAGLRAAK